MNENVSEFEFGFALDGDGCTYAEKDYVESLCFVTRHESMTEIIKTISHEDIHRVLWYDDLEEKKEHRVIYIMQWAEEYF